MPINLRAKSPFLLILILFIVGALAHQFALPVAEGSDEPIHVMYALLLKQENRLPNRVDSATNATRQASGQPPLTYWVGAAALRILNYPSINPDQAAQHLQTRRNPWLSPPDPWSPNDNLNHFIHGPNEIAFGAPELVTANRLLRLTALFFGVLAVIGAYNAASELFPDRQWALTAAALFAFMPTMVHITGYFTNDTSATAFAALVTWQALVLLRKGAAPRRLLVIGLLLALGGLSKVNTLLVASGVGLALLFDWRKRNIPFGQFLLNGLLVGLPLLLLFLPWVIYGVATYDDPFGFRTHYNPLFRHDPLLLPWETLIYMPEIYLSYWAKFGLAKVYLDPAAYTALGVIIVMALLGWIFAARRMKSLRFQQVFVLVVIALASFAGLVRWLQEALFITGRLLYPAHAAIALLLTLGLRQFASRFPRLEFLIRAYTVGLVMLAGVVLAPVSIYGAFLSPVSLPRDQLPPLRGTPTDFDDTIRFLGYTQQSPLLEGQIHTVTLCWEVLKTTEHPAAFSLKFVHDGVIVADRTSIHGLGRYPSAAWQPGVIFCDDVDVLMNDPDVVDDPQPEPGQTYDMLLVMLNASTQAADWPASALEGTPVQYPIIGQVVSPAGDMSAARAAPLTPSTIQFPGFARLEGYRLDGTAEPGQTLRLSLFWEVLGTTDTNWSQFIHLIGTDTATALADSIPRGGNYPTWAWSPGESVADTWTLTLPAELPPGEYALHIGFYRQDTGERMALMQDGTSMPDNSAILLALNVD